MIDLWISRDSRLTCTKSRNISEDLCQSRFGHGIKFVYYRALLDREIINLYSYQRKYNRYYTDCNNETLYDIIISFYDCIPDRLYWTQLTYCIFWRQSSEHTFLVQNETCFYKKYRILRSLLQNTKGVSLKRTCSNININQHASAKPQLKLVLYLYQQEQNR